jgi:hypothetical protein
MPEAGTPDTSTCPFVFQAAPNGTFAQAVSFGGSVVKTPKIVPIVFFAADSSKQQVADFVSKLATTAYWGKISSEYGAGALTAKPAIVLSETAAKTIDDNQIGPWLAAKFSSDPAHFGTPDSNTLYAIFYPDGTTITEQSGTSCAEFGGYHFETTAGNTPISYAVVPRSGSFGGLTGFDVTSFSTSHEVLEWATDPFPQSSPAYMSVDDDHAVWGRVFLGELGDLCTQMDVPTLPVDLGFTVQRTWSNASAKAGHHPCAPVTKDPYFTAFPTSPDRIPVQNEFGQSIMTQGFKVAVGEKKTSSSRCTPTLPPHRGACRSSTSRSSPARRRSSPTRSTSRRGRQATSRTSPSPAPRPRSRAKGLSSIRRSASSETSGRCGSRTEGHVGGAARAASAPHVGVVSAPVNAPSRLMAAMASCAASTTAGSSGLVRCPTINVRRIAIRSASVEPIVSSTLVANAAASSSLLASLVMVYS